MVDVVLEDCVSLKDSVPLQKVKAFIDGPGCTEIYSYRYLGRVAFWCQGLVFYTAAGSDTIILANELEGDSLPAATTICSRGQLGRVPTHHFVR